MPAPRGPYGEISLFEIFWEEDTLTLMLSKGQSHEALGSRLQVTLGEKGLFVDRNNPSVTLGRQAQNDLLVNDSIASRLHARIQYQRGTFVLIDQRTNGAYVREEGETPVFLHHDELVLGASGMIGLGRETDSVSPDVEHFVCVHQGDTPSRS